MPLRASTGLALCLALSPPLALAQDAGSLLREQQREQQLQQPPERSSPDAQADQPRSTRQSESGSTITVRQLVFAGQTELLPAHIQEKLSAQANNRSMGIQDLQALADSATRSLQDQGHILARVVLPPQNVTSGVVTLKIIQGRIGLTRIQSDQSVRAKEGRLQAIANDGLSSDNTTRKDLEATLLRMNDHPGVSARARLTPGETTNTSQLLINVDQKPVLSTRLGGDNYGSTATGEERLKATATLTDASGYGDLTKLSVTDSTGQTFTSARFSMPLGISDTTANTRYSYLQYHNTDDIGKALELEGYAHFAGVGLSHRLIRSRNLNLRVSGDVTWKSLIDDSLFGRLQDKRSLAGTVEFTGDARDRFLGSGLTYWSLAWTLGNLDLSRQSSALAADQASLRTNGQFQRINAILSRLQNLPDSFSLYARLYGQWASKNLDSSEEFSLGGPYGVRGWPVGEGAGDMGVLGTLELRYDIPSVNHGQLQVATFLDSGRVWVNADRRGSTSTAHCQCNDYELTSLGVSGQWSLPPFTFSVSYAAGLGENPGRSRIDGTNSDDTTDNQQFWLTGTARF